MTTAQSWPSRTDDESAEPGGDVDASAVSHLNQYEPMPDDLIDRMAAEAHAAEMLERGLRPF